MKRRAFLVAAGSSALAGCSFLETEPETRTPPPTRTETPTPGAVDTLAALLGTLESAESGDVVRVSADAAIDVSGEWSIRVPAGVTLSGGGRAGGAGGATLYSTEGDETPHGRNGLLKFRLGEGARFTGFRLVGHHHEYVNPAEAFDGDYYAHRGGGVRAGSGAEVDNNEISGWVSAAVRAEDDAHVHDNFIHHNAWEGLGYGVAVPSGDHMPLVENNRFNYNRHSVTGGGGPDVGYVARNNVVGRDWVGAQFDMHGSDGMTGIAGSKIVIEGNVFRATTVVDAKTRDPDGVYPAILIRGTPTEGVWVERNRFYHPNREAAYEQTVGPTRAHFSGNVYNADETADPGDGRLYP